MSTTEPKTKIALSKHFSRGYNKILDSESGVDKNINLLLLKMTQYGEEEKPMNFDRYITYTTFDNIGIAFFSKSFGFLEAVRQYCFDLISHVSAEYL